MTLRVLGILAAAALIGGCGGDQPAASTAGDSPAASTAAAPKVTIKTFQFQPDPIEVKAGTAVVFENTDGTVHTVTGKGFDERLAEGADAEVMFDRPGTFKYVCTLHSGPGMKGEVVVR